jgi:hypothetical protein
MIDPTTAQPGMRPAGAASLPPGGRHFTVLFPPAAENRHDA